MEIILFVKKGADLSALTNKFKCIEFQESSALKRNFFELPKLCKEYELDLLHTQYFIPFNRPCPVVCTIHDICFEHYSNIFTKKEYYTQKLLIPYAAKKSKAVFTVSNHAKQDIASHYHIPESNLVVTYNAVNQNFRKLNEEELNESELRNKFDITGNRIILSVGNLQPRKNLPRLMRAFVKLKKDSHFSDVQLVVVGKKAWMFDDIMKESADNNKDNSLVKDNMKLMSYFGFINEYKCFLELVEAIKHLKDAGKLKSKLVVIGELKESDEYHKKVLEKIREYNLDNDIIVTGYLKDSVGDYLKASDFAVLPFYYGISVRNGSFLAAYQEGIDIITTKGDKNFPYDDVYLMNDNTPQTIASAIEYMQDNSLKSEHRKIDFYWDDISKQHVELYEKIYG